MICINENILISEIDKIDLKAINIIIKPYLLTNNENSLKNNFDMEKVRGMISIYQQLLKDMENTIIQKKRIKIFEKNVGKMVQNRKKLR